MFIEKLSEADVRRFLEENIKMDIEQIEMLDDKIYVRLGFEVEATGSQHVVEYVFTDFTVKGQNVFAKMGQDIVQEKWVDFMRRKFDKISIKQKANKQYSKSELEFRQSGKEL